MTKVYACLAGDWVCLNDDPNALVGERFQEPTLWWKEGAPIQSFANRSGEYEHTLEAYDFVMIHFRGKDYRIHPTFIQIVTEKDF